MERRDDDSVLHINDLPHEILANILCFLERFSDRRRAAEVCPTWGAVIDETMGASKYIGNGSVFWIPGNKWRPLTDIQEMGVARCLFSDVLSTREEVGCSQAADGGFLRPHLVRHVEFDGFMSQELFEAILKPLWKLQMLALHISTLSLLDLYPLRSYSFVQTLSRLSLNTEGFWTDDFERYDAQPVFLNMLHILDVHFPKLKIFDSSLPLFLDMELELFSLYADFIRKHQETLREVTLKSPFRWRVLGNHSGRQTAEELHQIHHKLDNMERQRLDELGRSAPLDLKILVFIIDDRKTIHPTTLGIKTMILAQTKLTKLYYLCWDYIDMPVNLIAKNCATLTEIGLTINDVTDGPVNCTVFANCLTLKKLLLEADGEYEFNDLEADAPRLQNPQALPKSLEIVVLRNIYLESSSVEVIAKELPVLDTLYLTNIGKIADLGMTLGCLLWILKESPTLKRLKVKGLNDASFGETPPDVEPELEASIAYSDSEFNDMVLADGAEGGDPEVIEKEFQKLVQESEGEECKRRTEKGIAFEDEIILSRLLVSSDMQTKYIPYIVRRKGVWTRES